MLFLHDNTVFNTFLRNILSTLLQLLNSCSLLYGITLKSCKNFFTKAFHYSVLFFESSCFYNSFIRYSVINSSFNNGFDILVLFPHSSFDLQKLILIILLPNLKLKHKISSHFMILYEVIFQARYCFELLIDAIIHFSNRNYLFVYLVELLFFIADINLFLWGLSILFRY
jgi:hypothetical protein